MDKTDSPIQRLPESFSGNVVDLWGITPSAWPQVQQMSKAQYQFAEKRIFGAAEKQPHLSAQDKYMQMCDHLFWHETALPRITDSPRRYYWVYAPEQDRLVGSLSAIVPHNKGEDLTIGYFTLPEYRNKGFATAAVMAFSNMVSERGLTPALRARTEPENKESVHILLKTGFQELTRPVAPTPRNNQKKFRRFMKSFDSQASNNLLSASNG